MCVGQYYSTFTEQYLAKTRNYCTTFYISLCWSRGWFSYFCIWPLPSYCCLASTHSAAMLVTFWLTWFYFLPLSSHCCLAFSPSTATRMLVTFWSTWSYFRPLSWPLLLPGLHLFRWYVGNLMVHLVLILASVLTLLPSLHSFRCYVGNLLVYMVLFLTSVLTLLPSLHSFRCYVGNLLVHMVLFSDLCSYIAGWPSLLPLLCW